MTRSSARCLRASPQHRASRWQTQACSPSFSASKGARRACALREGCLRARPRGRCRCPAWPGLSSARGAFSSSQSRARSQAIRTPLRRHLGGPLRRHSAGRCAPAAPQRAPGVLPCWPAHWLPDLGQRSTEDTAARRPLSARRTPARLAGLSVPVYLRMGWAFALAAQPRCAAADSLTLLGAQTCKQASIKGSAHAAASAASNHGPHSGS